MEFDSQVVELLGQQRLIGELIRDNLEVAIPVRDRGIDLITYADLSRQVAQFASRPIQMKASTTRALSLDKNFERIVDVIISYVWHSSEPKEAETYALSYPEAVQVAQTMGYTATESWRQGRYTTTSPSKRLITLLEPYRMTSGRWWNLIVGSEPLPASGA